MKSRAPGMLVIFFVLLAADLFVVSKAGTDIPFFDQWDAEGAWLYPRFLDGSLRFLDLFQPHNEHRILWTHLLNLGLFVIDGQWDPLVQLFANGFLRALLGAGLYACFVREHSRTAKIGAALAVVGGFLPLAGWHNVLWSFQSQVLIAIGCVVGAGYLLTAPQPTLLRTTGGFLIAVAGMFAMAPAQLLPFAVFLVRVFRTRESGRVRWGDFVAVVGLVIVAVLCRSGGAFNADRAKNVGEWCWACARSLAWPHTGQPLAALVMNLPLVIALARRWHRKRATVPTDDFAACLGVWAIGVAAAAGWARGGGEETVEGVPSRYADFLVFLPLANLYFLIQQVGEYAGQYRNRIRLLTGLWVGFLTAGWVGLSFESVSRILLPRARDRQAPIRLARSYQKTGDEAVYVGQPRLYLLHPNPAVALSVMRDPKMQTRLPPSLQPDQPMGRLSRWVRIILEPRRQ